MPNEILIPDGSSCQGCAYWIAPDTSEHAICFFMNESYNAFLNNKIKICYKKLEFHILDWPEYSCSIESKI